MEIKLKTIIHHDKNANGTQRERFCCGCWNTCLDEDRPLVPYAQCNECGEIRVAIFPGINT